MNGHQSIDESQGRLIAPSIAQFSRVWIQSFLSHAKLSLGWGVALPLGDAESSLLIVNVISHGCIKRGRRYRRIEDAESQSLIVVHGFDYRCSSSTSGREVPGGKGRAPTP